MQNRPTQSLPPEEKKEILDEFYHITRAPNDMAYAVAAMKILSERIKKSKATTLMGLQHELKDAIGTLTSEVSEISVKSGCELLMCFLTRTSSGSGDFQSCKQRLIEQSEVFHSMTTQNRNTIAQMTERFFRDGLIILTHSYSRVVMNCLLHAAESTHFTVIVAEGGPSKPGIRTAKELAEHRIPVTVIPDIGVGAIMPRVDFVLVGAAAVVESGGVVNRLGTFQIACVAKEYKKPFYVAVESYKFTRIYPLTLADLMTLTPIDQIPQSSEITDLQNETKDQNLVKFEAPALDYTPPSYVELLFTDLGILCPSAVSDELIKLYHE
nr:translation initiation factor eIF-2B subunit alpha [Paratrimastix eleionoma]